MKFIFTVVSFIGSGYQVGQDFRKILSRKLPKLYVVCIACVCIANFEFPRVTYILFSIFRGVMLVLISLIYDNKFGHFECTVNFWQTAILLRRVLARLRFLPLQFREQEKVTSGKIWGIRWLRQHCCVVFGQNSRTSNDVWEGVLSLGKSQFLFFHKFGRIASRKLLITCR